MTTTNETQTNAATALVNDLAYLHDNCEMLDHQDIKDQLSAMYSAMYDLATSIGCDPADFLTFSEYDDDNA